MRKEIRCLALKDVFNKKEGDKKTLFEWKIYSLVFIQSMPFLMIKENKNSTENGEKIIQEKQPRWELQKFQTQ